MSLEILAPIWYVRVAHAHLVSDNRIRTGYSVKCRPWPMHGYRMVNSLNNQDRVGRSSENKIDQGAAQAGLMTQRKAKRCRGFLTRCGSRTRNDFLLYWPSSSWCSRGRGGARCVQVERPNIDYSAAGMRTASKDAHFRSFGSTGCRCVAGHWRFLDGSPHAGAMAVARSMFVTKRGKAASVVRTVARRCCEKNRIDAVPHGFRSSFRDWAADCETDHPRIEVSRGGAGTCA